MLAVTAGPSKTAVRPSTAAQDLAAPPPQATCAPGTVGAGVASAGGGAGWGWVGGALCRRAGVPARRAAGGPAAAPPPAPRPAPETGGTRRASFALPPTLTHCPARLATGY